MFVLSHDMKASFKLMSEYKLSLKSPTPLLFLANSDKKRLLEKENKGNKKYDKKSKLHLFLGISTAIVALPFLILIKLISLVIPQQKWEDFWNQFSDW